MRSNMTGGGIHNSEFRRINRSFGRGNPRPFQPSQRQPSPPRTRRGDLFMEAGRLAVEYLVAHGLLSSNVLSECQSHRSSQDREISSLYVDGRSGSMARQRAASPDRVPGRRKSPNDQDPSMTRNNSYSRERRRYGLARSYSADWGHEKENEGSLSDKATASESLEADNDKFPKDTFKDADADADVCDSCLDECASQTDRHRQLQDETGKCCPHEDADSKMTSALQNKDVEELPKPFDAADVSCEETKDGTSNLSKENKSSGSELVVKHCEENNDTSKKDFSDLLRLCPSAEIPPTVHSSLINKNMSSESLMLSKGKNTSDTGYDSVNSMKDVTMNGSSEIPSSSEDCNSNCVGMALREHSFREAGVLDPGCTINQEKSVESLSFTNGTFSSQQKSNGLSELGNCTSIAKDRREKRPFEDENMGEGATRAKQWLSVAQSDEYSQLSDLSEKQSISQADCTITMNMFNECANQESFANVSLPLKGSIESTIEQGEEKHLFSSSFKICDLNLMEGSHMHENHNISGLLYPSFSAPIKNLAVDVDLSVNNNYSLTSGYNDGGAARKDIEIIDLEGASFVEVRSMDSSTRKMEVEIANMGSFPDNPQNCNDNVDGQDGYGFMISELLGNDVPNCSSVQPDINSLHNDIGLHHGEGIFSEDDHIYMSLGEIPISLLQGWEQPTQERNPFEL